MIKEKKKLVIIGILLIILGVITGIVVNKINLKSGYHKIDEEVIVDKIKISDIKIESKNNITTYKAKVKALKKYKIKYIEIEIEDKKNKYTLNGYIGKNLKKDEEAEISSSITEEIKEIKKVRYKIIK